MESNTLEVQGTGTWRILGKSGVGDPGVESLEDQENKDIL